MYVQHITKSHSAASWGIGGSVELQTVSPKSVHLGNGPPLIAPCCLLLMLISMPLWIVNNCCLAFPVPVSRDI